MEEESKDAVLSLPPADALDVLNRFDASLGACPSLDIWVEAKKKLLAKMGANAKEGIIAVTRTLGDLIDENAKASLWDLPPDDAMNIVYKIKNRGHAWQNPSSSTYMAAQDVRNRCAGQGIHIPPAPPRMDESGHAMPSPSVVAPPNQQWGQSESWQAPVTVPPPNNQWDQGGRGEKRQAPEAWTSSDPAAKSKSSGAPPPKAPPMKMDPIKMVQLGQKLSKELGVPLSSLPRERLEEEMRKAMANDAAPSPSGEYL